MAKILLVEDDKSLREIYGVRLQAEGYTIVTAGDGEEALATAIKERPDLIVSDVMMPKISGFDMLDILRSTTETKDVKVIMMTALSSEDQRARGEALGADRYLVKSQVGIEDVVRTVHDVLADGVGAPAGAPAPSFPSAAPADITPGGAPGIIPGPIAPGPQAAPTMPVMPEVPATPPVITEPAAAVPAPQPMPSPTLSELPIAPTPAPTVTNEPSISPSPQPAAPVAPAPQAAPIPQPIPQPTAPVQPLPQPTAPFSSPAPASLGERVIQPLTSPEPATAAPLDISAQMAQALGTAPTPEAPQQPQVPPQA